MGQWIPRCLLREWNIDHEIPISSISRVSSEPQREREPESQKERDRESERERERIHRTRESKSSDGERARERNAFFTCKKVLYSPGWIYLVQGAPSLCRYESLFAGLLNVSIRHSDHRPCEALILNDKRRRGKQSREPIGRAAHWTEGGSAHEATQ